MKSRTIVLEKVYPHPPEQVWTALTDQRALAEWLMPNDFEAEHGSQFVFRVDPSGKGDGTTYCEIEQIEKPKLLAYTFQSPGMKAPTLVTWMLRQAPGGTRLRLEHSDPESTLGWLQAKGLNKTWTTMTRELLPRVLANIREGHFSAGAVPTRERIYKVKTLPSGVELSPDRQRPAE